MSFIFSRDVESAFSFFATLFDFSLILYIHCVCKAIVAVSYCLIVVIHARFKGWFSPRQWGFDWASLLCMTGAKGLALFHGDFAICALAHQWQWLAHFAIPAAKPSTCFPRTLRAPHSPHPRWRHLLCLYIYWTPLLLLTYLLLPLCPLLLLLLRTQAL